METKINKKVVANINLPPYFTKGKQYIAVELFGTHYRIEKADDGSSPAIIKAWFDDAPVEQTKPILTAERLAEIINNALTSLKKERQHTLTFFVENKKESKPINVPFFGLSGEITLPTCPAVAGTYTKALHAEIHRLKTQKPPAPTQWHPVSEIPPFDTLLLIYENGYLHTGKLKCIEKKGLTFSSYACNYDNITHWMLAPELPTKPEAMELRNFAGWLTDYAYLVKSYDCFHGLTGSNMVAAQNRIITETEFVRLLSRCTLVSHHKPTGKNKRI